ncbi:group II intron reverse transcriptase [Ktedonosporobacter rubrisoli]|nr:reverse transcriptase domain-containing protein [Ktedonosporobacter rubrisoli]
MHRKAQVRFGGSQTKKEQQCHLVGWLPTFDRINHQALLEKLATFPTIRQIIKSWLKAGMMENETLFPTKEGTPQGGVISSLLENIALHGLETCIKASFPASKTIKGETTDNWKPTVIRYADDFLILHRDRAVIEQCKELTNTRLKGMGLELKPSKTKITHTLEQYQGQVGFDFLGWHVRQYPVGKNRSAIVGGSRKLLGFKTFIKPSQEAVKGHMVATREVIRHNRAAPQGKVIKELNPIIKGWTNYHRTVVSKETCNRCDHLLYLQLASWAGYRHPNKGKRWIAQKYWHVHDGQGWKFSDGKSKLWNHSQTAIQRHAKVRGAASPYDGNLLYWSQRLHKHPMMNGIKAKLLQKQGGKCRWCELLFKDGDIIEVDHITPKSEGGGEELSNKFALHRHCHDDRHAKRVNGTSDKGYILEEPCEVKISSTVLQTSAGGDSCA